MLFRGGGGGREIKEENCSLLYSESEGDVV